ncbi:hypothetical protein H5410_046016 [Solanum commersonii]|uniref:Uncharacterized protein n=1 Tax=Solanum commersonii TaxID=4109 RepID=A0A9J5XEF7_SOLCO|nr:hypothetical protein H5410_046016 [Solanum commersonii]
MLYLKLHTKIKFQTSIYSCQKMCCEGSLSDPPFGLPHLLSAVSLSIFTISSLELWASLRPFGDSPNALGDPHAFFSSSFQLPCSFLPSSFKKDVSNSATQNSIMNVYNKAQFTHARINCILKDSSYDTPLSKILKLTILASNASSSSTKVFKCPHTEE